MIWFTSFSLEIQKISEPGKFKRQPYEFRRLKAKNQISDNNDSL